MALVVSLIMLAIACWSLVMGSLVVALLLFGVLAVWHRHVVLDILAGIGLAHIFGGRD
jgi:hypothetical protein